MQEFCNKYTQVWFIICGNFQKGKSDSVTACKTTRNLSNLQLYLISDLLSSDTGVNRINIHQGTYLRLAFVLYRCNLCGILLEQGTTKKRQQSTQNKQHVICEHDLARQKDGGTLTSRRHDYANS